MNEAFSSWPVSSYWISQTKTTLRLAATVGLMPTAAIVYSLVATPFWTPLFIVPGLACFAFAVYGFWLASRLPTAAAVST